MRSVSCHPVGTCMQQGMAMRRFTRRSPLRDQFNWTSSWKNF